MRPLLVALALVACSRHAPGPDPRIEREYRALWDARAPALARPVCPDGEARRDRLTPLLQLAADASSAWRDYTQPLPKPFADRLVALDVPATAAEDLRCLLVDPGSRSIGWALMGVVAALLERRGELATDWSSILAALRIYRDAPAQVYLYFFQPAYFLERATSFAAEHPPPPELRADLVAAAHGATMPVATLCAGEQEELLAHGASLFYGHVAALRPELLARWGPELGELYTDDYAARTRPSYATWTAFRALWDPVAHDCTRTPPAELRARLGVLLGALRSEDPGAAALLEVTVSRLGDYDRLRAAEAAFVAKLP